MKAIIPCAGLGTRFLPITKAQAKEMLPVVDKPAIQYIVEEALSCGANEVIIVNSHEKPSIEKHFAPDAEFLKHLYSKGKNDLAQKLEKLEKMNVSFVYQEEALGLGDAVNCAAQACAGEQALVMLGDVVCPTDSICKKMLEISREHNDASVICVFEVPQDQVSRFGVIGGKKLSDKVYRINEMVEKPPQDQAPSNLAIFGRYLLSNKIFKLLDETQPGAGGEIQLTDALVELLKQEEVYAYVMDSNEGYDTGTIETWLNANIEIARLKGIL